MKYEIKNRLDNSIIYVAEIDCPEDTPGSLKKGLAAISAAINGVSLARANLRGADLSDADLSDAKIDYKIQDGLLLAVAKAGLATQESLEMRKWHTCDTTHCIAGWACHLSPVAKELEKTHDTQIAALLTLGAKAHTHFFDDNQTARAWLESVIEEEEAKAAIAKARGE